MTWRDAATIVAVVALLALYLFMRRRPAPRGTYDDENVRSRGSIGGGTRAYDDPAMRSSGSIGGTDRGYDSPEHESGGSIGADDRARRLDRDEPNARDNERDDARDDEFDERPLTDAERARRKLRAEERRHDDDRFKSGGSFGG